MTRFLFAISSQVDGAKDEGGLDEIQQNKHSAADNRFSRHFNMMSTRDTDNKHLQLHQQHAMFSHASQ